MFSMYSMSWQLYNGLPISTRLHIYQPHYRCTYVHYVHYNKLNSLVVMQIVPPYQRRSSSRCLVTAAISARGGLTNLWYKRFRVQKKWVTSAIFKKYLQCVLAAKILTVDFVVCTLAVKKNQGGFDKSDRTIPLSVEQSHSWKADSHSANKYFLKIYHNIFFPHACVCHGLFSLGVLIWILYAFVLQGPAEKLDVFKFYSN
jgi:hypothetical protein